MKVGELLAKEEAAVAMVLEDRTATHCWHCLLPCQAPLPCSTCSKVVFCSSSCRSLAVAWHPHECGYVCLLYQAEVGAWWLAYRALTRLPWSHYRERWPEYGARQEQAGLGERLWTSTDPLSFHQLVSHDGAAKEAAELMMQAHVVVFLVRLLRATGYLQEEGEGLAEEERKAALLLHHFMRVTFYNTHETTELEKTGPGWGDNSLQRMGRATNPSLALVNHSCDPNYDRVSYGRVTLGLACKPIAAGEEIVDTYCQPFVALGREERRDRLAKYNFLCQCPACGGDWPRMERLEASLEGLPESSYLVPMGEGLGRVARAEAAVEEAQTSPEEALPAVCRLLEELHRLVRRPHQAITYWESRLCELLLHTHSARVERHSTCTSTIRLPPGTL